MESDTEWVFDEETDHALDKIAEWYAEEVEEPR